MEKTIHGVVRLDKMSGTIDGAMLKSVKYNGDIDNGNVLKIAGLADGEREAYVGLVPEADTALKELVLIATPEVIRDESKRYGLEDFYNAKGELCRGYRFHSGDIFSVTKECLEVTDIEAVVKGWKVGVTDGSTKLTVAATVTGTEIGTILDIETVGSMTYYVVEVNL